MRNISLEKSSTKCSQETIPRPFFKISKLSVSLDRRSKVLYNLFFVVCRVKVYPNILKLRCGSLAFTSYKAFLKIKKRSGTSLPPSFSG